MASPEGVGTTTAGLRSQFLVLNPGKPEGSFIHPYMTPGRGLATPTHLVLFDPTALSVLKEVNRASSCGEHHSILGGCDSLNFSAWYMYDSSVAGITTTAGANVPNTALPVTQEVTTAGRARNSAAATNGNVLKQSYSHTSGT